MRPFTRAAGQLEKKEKTPSGMVTFAGDILVYKTHSEYIYKKKTF